MLSKSFTVNDFMIYFISLGLIDVFTNKQTTKDEIYYLLLH